MNTGLLQQYASPVNLLSFTIGKEDTQERHSEFDCLLNTRRSFTSVAGSIWDRQQAAFEAYLLILIS